MNLPYRLPLLAAVTGFVLAQPAHAEPAAEVEMLDRGPDGDARVFEPDVVHIDPGESVYFKATDLGHDVESLDSLRPEDAESFTGYRNAPLEVTFEAEGVHVYHCESHKEKGMVGVVVVGDPSVNLDEIKSEMEDSEALSDQGRARLAGMLDEVEAAAAQ